MGKDVKEVVDLVHVYDKDGKMLRGTKIPHNYIFIDKSVLRPEWDDLVWVSGTNKEL